MTTKTKALQRLRREIERELGKRPHSWFWTTGNEREKDEHRRLPADVRRVKGYWGTAPVMVVGYMPSWGKKPPKKRHRKETPNALFYRIMAQQGLQNAHITDAFKQRQLVQDKAEVALYPPAAAQARRWFMREARIIRPRAALTFGREVTETLRGWRLVRKEPDGTFTFKGTNRRRVPVVETYHPAAMRYKGRKVLARRFTRDFGKVARILNGSGERH